MSVAIIKIIGIIAISALLCLPFLPLDRFFTFYAKSYKGIGRRNNLVFVAATCIEVFFISWFAPLVVNLVNWIKDLGFVEQILKKIPDRIEYIVDVITLLSINLLLCAILLGAKKLTRTFLDKKVFIEAADAPLIHKEKKTRADKKSKDIKRKESEDKRIVSLRKHSVLIFGRLSSKKGVVSVDSENNDFTNESHDASDVDVGEHGVDEENLSKWQKCWYKLVGIVYDKKSGYVYIKPNTYRLAKELKIFTHTLFGLYIAACILMLVPVFFSFSALPGFYKIVGFIINNTFFYPVLTLVVLFEILYYVDGELEKLECPQEDFLSVATGRTEKKEIDLPELKKEILEDYGEKYDIIHCNIAASGEKSVYKPKESKREVMQSIHNLIQKRYGIVNNRFLEGIEYMLDGKNVLFDSSFYSSLGEYIVNYLFIHLTFGNRALFICKDEKEKKNLRSYLAESTKEIIKFPSDFWRIGDYESVHEGELPDILILVPEDFSRKSLFSDGKNFFDELVDVFVPDVDDIISANNYYCVIMAKKLEKATTHYVDRSVDAEGSSSSRPRLRYRFFVRGKIHGIDNSVRQFFNMGDVGLDLLHSFDANPKSELFIWRTGSDSTHYVDKGANQMPLEAVIAQKASAKNAPSISLITESELYSTHLQNIRGLYLNKCKPGLSPLGFVVVADDRYNLPNAIFDYTRFSGCANTVVHIVSKPYLLRDFFADKAEEYVEQFEIILGKTAAEHADAKKIAIIKLFCDAINGMIREDFIERAAAVLGDALTAHTVEECVLLCYKEAFGEVDGAPKYYLSVDTNTEHEKKVFVTVSEPDNLFKRLLESEKNVRVKFSTETADRVLPTFAKEISQYYIAGQIISLDNKPYVIQSVDSKNGVIEVDDANVDVGIPGDYIPSRVYTMTGTNSAVKTINPTYGAESSVVTSMKISQRKASFDVDTAGYYSIESVIDTINLNDPLLSTYIKLNENIKRSIDTNMLVVELFYKGTSNVKITYTMAVIIQEFMKTMFPDEYRCVSVCPFFDISAEDEKSFYESNERICALYPRFEESSSAMKLLDSTGVKKVKGKDDAKADGVIRFAIIEDINGGNGCVKAIFGENDEIISNILYYAASFLEWAITKDSDENRLKYLFYGYDKCPEVFDFEGLYDIIAQFKYTVKRHTDKDAEKTKKCFFCHKLMGEREGRELSDGRVVCNECVETTTDTYEKLEALFDGVLKAIKSSTNVPDSFPKDISVDFVSTYDIQKRFDGAEVGEYPIAYCNHATGRIYVEYGLSAAAVCDVLARFITELWQDKNIANDGSAIYFAHASYVEVQTLTALKHKAMASALKRMYGSREGHAQLKTELAKLGHDDTFAYFIEEIGAHKKRGEELDPDPESTDTERPFIVERDPDTLPRFYRDTLSGNERAIYDQLTKAVYNYESEIKPMAGVIKVDDFSKLVTMFVYDNPEVFWWQDMKGVMNYDSDGNMTSYRIEYTLSAERVKKRKMKIEKAIAPFVGGITVSMSDYDVALKAFENIVDLIDYDTLALNEEHAGRISSDAPDDIRSIYGVFVDKKAVCAGYAKAYQFLLNRMGIECTYVAGKCHEGGLHAWNLIKLEGDYYYVDVTWGDGSNTDKSRDSGGEIRYNYFCITTDELLRTRDIRNATTYPICTAVKCNYHYRNGLYFKTFDADKFRKILTDAVKQGKKRIAMKFETKALYDFVRDRMVTCGGARDIVVEAGGTRSSAYMCEELHIIDFILT